MKKNTLILALAAGFLLACGSVNQSTSENNNNPVATPSASASGNASSLDIGYMDKTVRPQDDFFMFANGTWVKNNPVPASESRWGSFNELEFTNKEKLTKILDECVLKGENPVPLKKGTPVQVLGDFYYTFKNSSERNRLGISAIQPKLDEIDAMTAKEQLPKVLAEMHSNGISALFGFGVGQDLKNVEFHAAYIRQSGLGLPNRDYYTEDKYESVRKDYQKFMFECFKSIASNEDEASTMAAEAYKFELALAEKMLRPEERRDPEKTYNKNSLDEFKHQMKNFKFDEYLTKIGSESFKEIIIDQPAYFTHVNEIVKEFPFSRWKSYLKWRIFNHYMEHLDETLENRHFDFYGKVLSGKKEIKPLDERAINLITDMEIGDALGQLYVERHYSKEAQERVNEMVDNLLVVFRERIQNLEWMSDSTKILALNKLNSIGRKLGFPEEWTQFKELSLSRNSYIENLDSLAAYSYKRNLAKLRKPVDKKEWGMPAHMVNAYYHPLLNEIAFPAGIMQPPFFSDSYEDAVNYGRIGMVIGHEFTHGFDDMGSKFAADGTFENWWSDEDRTKFNARTETLGQTYSTFCPVDGHCVNPKLTMGENIADLGGLTLAYYAYAKTDDFKSGKIVEGYTPAQRFFIAYAQLWKINYTEEELKKRVATDSHSPGMYRVNGPLMNCPEFFEAFDVKEGDPMRNPDLKVAKIW